MEAAIAVRSLGDEITTRPEIDLANIHERLCWTSEQEISDITGRPMSEVQQGVAEMIEAGWLVKISPFLFMMTLPEEVGKA